MASANGTETMRAIGFHEHGSIDNLELLEVERPAPAPDEVLVDVEAAALNYQDVFAVRELDHYVSEYPFWGGGDMAGVIDETGGDVEGWTIGDRVLVNPALWCGECELCLRGQHSMCVDYNVYGEHRKGGFGEYVTVPEENLIPVPDHYPLEKACAIPVAGGTAWRAMDYWADIDPHDDLLIVGASGGVGTYTIQIAKNVFNVETIYGTTSSDEKAEFIRDLGVDHVIDYTEEAFDERIWELTDKRGVDVVYNTVGGDTWQKSMRSLQNGGKLVTSGATAGPNPETEIRLIFMRQLQIIGSTSMSRTDINRTVEQVWDGTIEPIIEDTYPLEEYETAFERMTNRDLFGKVVLAHD
jgi:NADPH:quinone reductase-like Zn-dependent oxidoreductase